MFYAKVKCVQGLEIRPWVLSDFYLSHTALPGEAFLYRVIFICDIGIFLNRKHHLAKKLGFSGVSIISAGETATSLPSVSWQSA